MEKAAGGGEEPATRAAGGMCDRFLTFLAKNLTMSKTKTISDGPKNAGAGGGQTLAKEGEVDGEEDDEFAIPIERAEFDYEFAGDHGEGGGYSSVATILGESAAATTTTRDDVSDEPNPEAATAAADDDTAAEMPAPAAAAAVEETTKVRKTVTIKEEDRSEQEAGGGGSWATRTVERKMSSLFKKRQASSVGAGDERGVPRRSGLRPRITPALRVPSNINERSSTFIEERRKSFGRGGGGKLAPDK